VKEFFQDFFQLLSENIEVYSNYVQELDVEEEDCFNIFGLRDEIAAVLFASPILPVAKELRKKNKLFKLLQKLRRADLELSKRSSELAGVIDFAKWRESLEPTPPRFEWWYYLDEVSDGKIQIPPQVQLSFSLYGTAVEGVVDGEKCQVLLISPVIPRLARKIGGRELVKNFYSSFVRNAAIDLPQIFLDEEKKKQSLLLPTSAFWGDFKKLTGFNPYIKNKYLAVPRKNSKFLSFFLEEFLEKVKTGNGKIFSQKVLTSEEFTFFPLKLVRKYIVEVTLTPETDLHSKLNAISKEFMHVPDEVAIVSGG